MSTLLGLVAYLLGAVLGIMLYQYLKIKRQGKA